MKRSAAIIGPTPPFLRWAIEASCPFRRPAKTSLPDSAWRQLRPLKELSRAFSERRVYAGYCFPPNPDPQRILAFPVSEVANAYGGELHVAQTCRQCAANPQARRDRWAGCTGVLPLIELGQTAGQIEAQWEQLLHEIELVLCQPFLAESAGRLARDTRPRWFGLWKGQRLAGPDLQYCQDGLLGLTQALAFDSFEWHELVDAIAHGLTSGAAVWAEMVPAGISDGVNWTLPAHCRACGAPWKEQSQGVCACCASAGSYHAEGRRRVLGHRPYLELSGLVGESAASELQTQYLKTGGLGH